MLDTGAATVCHLQHLRGGALQSLGRLRHQSS
jgi:hypothetical protein